MAKIDAHIVWADSDKNIENSAGILKQSGIKIHFFNDTPSCLEFFEKEGSQFTIILTTLCHKSISDSTTACIIH